MLTTAMTTPLNSQSTDPQRNRGSQVPLAQLVEHLTFNQGVAGSSPARHILLSFLTSSLSGVSILLTPFWRCVMVRHAPHFYYYADLPNSTPNFYAILRLVIIPKKDYTIIRKRGTEK